MSEAEYGIQEAEIFVLDCIGEFDNYHGRRASWRIGLRACEWWLKQQSCSRPNSHRQGAPSGMDAI